MNGGGGGMEDNRMEEDKVSKRGREDPKDEKEEPKATKTEHKPKRVAKKEVTVPKALKQSKAVRVELSDEDSESDGDRITIREMGAKSQRNALEKLKREKANVEYKKLKEANKVVTKKLEEAMQKLLESEGSIKVCHKVGDIDYRITSSQDADSSPRDTIAED